MHPSVIKLFGLSTETSFDLICSNAGEMNITLQTGPNHIQCVLDDKVITTILKHKSQVFALWIVLAATGPSQVRYLCNNFGLFEPGINIQGLNSSYVRIDICNNTDMPNPTVSKTSLMKATSNLFEVMLIHTAPPQSGYMSSLCKHLDEASIDSLSIDGCRIHSTAGSLSRGNSPRYAGFKRHAGLNPCLSCAFQCNSCRNGVIISVHSSVVDQLQW
jgi:hypothetical protein